MVNPRENSIPLSQWYGQPSPYIQPPPPYYYPYPQYNPYIAYQPYPPPVASMPIHPRFPPYLYYPSGVPQPQPMPMSTVPSIVQRPPEPDALAETRPKFPSLPTTLNPAPIATEEPSNPDKLSHKKENGVYKCHKCERTYLSYPALYTHNKLKHPTAQLNANTKTTNRGRPKKNVK